MARISVSVQIGAPVERVWQVVEPIERHVDWMADAVAIRFTGQQTRGAGTEFECDTKVGPFTLVDKMTVTSWEPMREMGVRHSGIVTGSGVFTLAPSPQGGTVFTWTESLVFPWWMGGPVGAFVGGKVVMRLIWVRNLKKLKKIAESAA